MHLKNQSGLQPFSKQTVMNPVHGNLDNICSCTLDRRVHSYTFTKGTLHKITGFQLRNRTSAPVERRHITVLLRILHLFVQKCLDLRIGCKILLDIGCCLFPRDAQILTQTKGADAVNDTEIDRLCIAPL